MIKKFLINRLINLSAWIGGAIIFSAMFLPDSITICLGAFLVITPDNKLQELIKSWSPKVKEFLEKDI